MKTRPNHKDEALLLLVALVCAAGCWAFWHYLGAQWGGALVVVLVILGLTRENRRLRRQIRDQDLPK